MWNQLLPVGRKSNIERAHFRSVQDVVPAGVPKTFWLVLEVPDRRLSSREGEEGVW